MSSTKSNQHLPQPVNAVIAELRLVQETRTESDLQDRHGGGAVLHDDRRLNAIKARIELVGPTICEIARSRVHIGLEIDFLQRDAVNGLGLDVLDTVDVGADRILAISG